MKFLNLLVAVMIAVSCNGNSPKTASKSTKKPQLTEAALRAKRLAEGQTQDTGKKEVKKLEKTVVETIDGKKLNIGEGSGKPTVLVLFATWCPHCEKALPVINSVFKPHLRKINVVAAGHKHTKAELEEFQGKFKFSFNLVADENSAVYNMVATKYVPHVIVIDANGNIKEHHVGWSTEATNDLLKRVLAL